MKNFFAFVLGAVLVSIPCSQVAAQNIASSLKKTDILKIPKLVAIVVKREVTPGVVTMTRTNGCWLQNPVVTHFLDDGTILETSVRLTAFGNSVPQWRNEYRKPWQSQLTDYEGGEQKIMILQIGRHPSTLIGVEQSDTAMLEAQTLCATAAYKIFGSNLKLLKPILEQKENNLSLSLKHGWETHFSN